MIYLLFCVAMNVAVWTWFAVHRNTPGHLFPLGDRVQRYADLLLFSGSTGKAIVLSALTAMIGFGSMMISTYRGLSSLGLLMFLGVGMCLVTSILVLPQILVLILRRQRARKK